MVGSSFRPHLKWSFLPDANTMLFFQAVVSIVELILVVSQRMYSSTKESWIFSKNALIFHTAMCIMDSATVVRTTTSKLFIIAHPQKMSTI